MVYPAFYNGPVSYFARLIREREIILEQHEHYTKQTYRNRCEIMGPNGVLSMTIPVKRKRGMKNRVRDIRIDYDTPWQKIHWRSMVAAYTASPFFQYMKDDLEVFYKKRTRFLIDLNRELLEKCLLLLGKQIPVSLSGSFSKMQTGTDLRELIHPKRDPDVHDPLFRPVPYHQVFSDRMGFKPNLSILDLLFNEGNQALSILEKSLRT
ncbi:MAG: WbqC family protein [Bacteroidales bacterium]